MEECSHGCSAAKNAELMFQGMGDFLSLQMDFSWLAETAREDNAKRRKIKIVLQEERERIAAGRGDERIIPGTSRAEDRIQRFWILDREERKKKIIK